MARRVKGVFPWDWRGLLAGVMVGGVWVRVFLRLIFWVFLGEASGWIGEWTGGFSGRARGFF